MEPKSGSINITKKIRYLFTQKQVNTIFSRSSSSVSKIKTLIVTYPFTPVERQHKCIRRCVSIIYTRANIHKHANMHGVNQEEKLLRTQSKTKSSFLPCSCKYSITCGRSSTGSKFEARARALKLESPK